ncbi:hypothetical protein LEQ41_06450 [Streptococcus agalactiae]|nr:hypothetical protein [Streptococcus agalactiae]
MILHQKIQKRLEIKAFLNPETVGFIPLSPAVRLPPHDAYLVISHYLTI